MRMAEEFERCEKCGQGWFEEKKFVLVDKNSPKGKQPQIYRTEIQYQCVGCGNTQYKHTEE